MSEERKRSALDLPIELHTAFKIACTQRGVTMQDATEAAIRGWTEQTETGRVLDKSPNSQNVTDTLKSIKVQTAEIAKTLADVQRFLVGAVKQNAKSIDLPQTGVSIEEGRTLVTQSRRRRRTVEAIFSEERDRQRAAGDTESDKR